MKYKIIQILFAFLSAFNAIAEYSSTPRLLIKIPTRSRPEQFFRVLDLYYAKLSYKIPYHFLITCDLDDNTMNNQDIKDKFKCYKNLTYTFSRNLSKVEAYNKDLEKYLDFFDILLIASDDMEPYLNNFDEIIVNRMLENFPNFDGVLNFFDGYTIECNTYPIIGREFYKQFGYVYYPGYKGFCCDVELAEISRALNKEKICSEKIIQHKYPGINNSKNKWDALYEKNEQYHNEDKALYAARKKYNFFCLVGLVKAYKDTNDNNLCTNCAAHKKPKIVGLMQIRNEEIMLEQHLRALACYTDAIVIIDDASMDSSLKIIKNLAQELNIEKIITHSVSAWECGKESNNYQTLLDEGRKIGGTHFILIDADEMFSVRCLKDSVLRNKILSLKPGDSMAIPFINLWRSLNQYRQDDSVWSNRWMACIYCDDGKCSYADKWLHAKRLPANLCGQKITIQNPNEICLVHFQFVNWQNLLIKQAWYRCLEHIRNPDKSTEEINKMYGQSKDETNLATKSISTNFLQYPFFDSTIYNKEQIWRKKQVKDWFGQYGREFFKDLDIWDINWESDE